MTTPAPALTHAAHGRDDAAPALALLCDWTPSGRPVNPLQPGDLGWHLRFDAEEVAGSIHVWSASDGPVAVGLLDGPVLRLALNPAPGWDIEALADAICALTDGTEAWCDAPSDALKAALLSRGWNDDTGEPWPIFFLGTAPAFPASAAIVTEAGAADRVAVQRAAFEGSTFTAERWQAMKDSLAGHLAVEVIVRTPGGEPAAAATGWLAGPGKCAVLEPVGAHPDHRGHRHARAAVHAACAALFDRGASGVSVLTPGDNTAAVALYTSAGFRREGQIGSLHRPARA
ncbi:GNAT family N-acetyltransferase [Longispora albida]|uniref:GNAT family N-acetyltransferase n=1 Tax=Longispora albida TaxID=203523 RepID=UPI00037B5338|nr:GNAT family N-acetyltransferase [Longispora albida]